MLSAISQELCELDANMIAEECLDKLELDEGSVAMESTRRPSTHSVTWQARDSRHSTLVIDSEASKATDESN